MIQSPIHWVSNSPADSQAAPLSEELPTTASAVLLPNVLSFRKQILKSIALNVILIYPFTFYSGPWDLEVPTNAVVFERAPLSWPHPHPEIESYRSTLVIKLRQAYQEMCHSREGLC